MEATRGESRVQSGARDGGRVRTWLEPRTVPDSAGHVVSVSRAVAIDRHPRTAGASRTLTISRVVQWTFYAYIFSLLFEMPKRQMPFEIPTLVGCVLLFVAVFYPRACFRDLPWAFWCFLIYTAIDISFMLFLWPEWPEAGFPEEVLKRIFWIVQLLFLFLVAYNLMTSERVALEALWALVTGCVVLVVLQLSGVAYTVEDLGRTSRPSAFGQNPSHMAGHLAVGVLMLFGLTYGRDSSSTRLRMLALPAFALLGISIVLSGARGPLVALLVGFVFLLFRPGSFRSWVTNAVILCLAAGFFVVQVERLEATKRRLVASLQERSLAGREAIYPSAWEMFLERPVFGWGAITHQYELASRVRDGYKIRDPHNLFLEIVTTNGLVGLTPFALGLWMLIAAAWRSRHGPHGILPMALVAAVLINNLSINWLFSKVQWLVFAYALASLQWRGVTDARRQPMQAVSLR